MFYWRISLAKIGLRSNVLLAYLAASLGFIATFSHHLWNWNPKSYIKNHKMRLFQWNPPCLFLVLTLPNSVVLIYTIYLFIWTCNHLDNLLIQNSQIIRLSDSLICKRRLTLIVPTLLALDDSKSANRRIINKMWIN